MSCAIVRSLVLSLLIGISAAAAIADEFDVIRSYRFLPRLSNVEQNGGFAGRHETFSVWGKFDLNLGPEISIPELEIHPSFENVQSWLNPDGPLAYVLNTDRTFNLSGLEGSYIRPDRIAFRGVNEQGAAVELKVALAGRLLKITGGSHPPCCDFFDYQIEALAIQGSFADFNFDGIVDAADYTAWRNHVGMASGAMLEQGDADGDGDVDAADYGVWRQDQGTVTDLSAFAKPDAAMLTAVPEPSTFSSLACGVLSLLGLAQWLGRRAN